MKTAKFVRKNGKALSRKRDSFLVFTDQGRRFHETPRYFHEIMTKNYPQPPEGGFRSAELNYFTGVKSPLGDLGVGGS